MKLECYFCCQELKEGNFAFNIYEPPYIHSQTGEATSKNKISCEECWKRFKPDVLATLKQSNEFFWKQLDCIKAMNTATYLMSHKE